MTIDSAVNVFMQSIQFAPLIHFSRLIEMIFEPMFLVVASVFLSIYLFFKKSKKQAVFFVSTILVSGILVEILKEVFRRARPLNSVFYESGFSFPSGHATIAVVFFGLIAYIFTKKKMKLPTIFTTTAIILLIGFTRIYLRAHWLSDVVGGFVVGGAILALSIVIYKKL